MSLQERLEYELPLKVWTRNTQSIQCEPISLCFPTIGTRNFVPSNFANNFPVEYYVLLSCSRKTRMIMAVRVLKGRRGAQGQRKDKTDISVSQQRWR